MVILVALSSWGFFVPLHLYETSPSSIESRLSNVSLAFEFLTESGIRPRNRPSEVVKGDLKAVLRIIYCLFVKYKAATGEDQAKLNGWAEFKLMCTVCTYKFKMKI